MFSPTYSCLFEMFIFTSFHLEIPDFLSPEEADHIIDVAEYVGFAKSDIHLDPVAKQHGKTVRSTEGKSQVQPQALRAVFAWGGVADYRHSPLTLAWNKHFTLQIFPEKEICNQKKKKFGWIRQRC